MKKIDENNKWIIQTVVVSLCFLLFLYLCFFKDLPTQRYDDLWPENGDVIATIDGKEYRYDPVYLYRLTNCVFDEDYRKSSEEIVDDFLNKGMITAITVDLLSASSMAEVAVDLELFFEEGKTHFDGNKMYIKSLKNDYKEWYRFMPKNNNSMKLSSAYEKSKFSVGQSNKAYLKKVGSYIKKFAYIKGASEYFGENIDEYNKYLGERYEKYNVKMVY